MQDFRKLRVWQSAVELAVSTYRATKQFPNHERFGLVSQMQKAAVSIASNIAEGAGRGTRRDSKYFLQIAYGSASELSSQYSIALALGYISSAESDAAIAEIEKVRAMLAGLMQRLK
jgi:four helix bundle protein